MAMTVGFLECGWVCCGFVVGLLWVCCGLVLLKKIV